MLFRSDRDQDRDQDQIVAAWQVMVRAEPAQHMAIYLQIRRVQLVEVDGKQWVILSQRIASSATMMSQARVDGKWSFTTMAILWHVLAVSTNLVFTWEQRLQIQIGVPTFRRGPRVR